MNRFNDRSKEIDLRIQAGYRANFIFRDILKKKHTKIRHISKIRIYKGAIKSIYVRSCNKEEEKPKKVRGESGKTDLWSKRSRREL